MKLTINATEQELQHNISLARAAWIRLCEACRDRLAINSLDRENGADNLLADCDLKQRNRAIHHVFSAYEYYQKDAAMEAVKAELRS